MQKLNRYLLFYIVVWLMAGSCSNTRQILKAPVNISSLKFIGQYTIPYNLQVKQTTVGGLSGIDYDAGKNLYYLISDDRSDKNPTRFYTAKIMITQNGIDSMIFTGVHFFQQPDGSTYPNNKSNRFKTPDPEAIRYHPKTKQLTWSSEGERVLKNNDTVLTDPAIVIINRKGKYIDSFALPLNLKMQTIDKGPRRNGVLEGLSFADNYKTFFASVEEPLHEDGPQADLSDNGAFIRMYKFDVAEKKCIGQYAYKLEPVAFPPNPATAFKLNGVSEILSLGNNKLLVMERSFSTGRLACAIRLFIADLNGATDVSQLTLKGNTSFTPAKKTLLLNMDDLGIYIDNIEGVSFGPTLPNGNKTLLFIADNNFNFLEKAQVMLFEVVE